MSFHTFSGIGLTLHVADKSALAAINRALRGVASVHRTPVVSVQFIIGPYGCPDECVKVHNKEEIVGLTDALRWYLGFHFREAYS